MNTNRDVHLFYVHFPLSLPLLLFWWFFQQNNIQPVNRSLMFFRLCGDSGASKIFNCHGIILDEPITQKKNIIKYWVNRKGHASSRCRFQLQQWTWNKIKRTNERTKESIKKTSSRNTIIKQNVNPFFNFVFILFCFGPFILWAIQCVLNEGRLVNGLSIVLYNSHFVFCSIDLVFFSSTFALPFT